jgi:tRNA threonylcarbamoyladenosine biosynthesis protein TsaE
MSETFLSESPEATLTWATQLGARLKPPLVIALFGQLGTGKTLVAKGIAAGLGVREAVTSPTFILINEYALPDGNRLYHVDCYRLRSEQTGEAVAAVKALGLEELFDRGLVLIEWADAILPLLPAERIDITLADAGPGRRRITLTDHRRSPVG